VRVLNAEYVHGLGAQVWLEHDANWIYDGNPTGHLHDVYYNQ
jgi:hypothetical protein